MSLHPAILVDLLDREVAQARSFLGSRANDLHRDGCHLLMTLIRPDGEWILRLDGTHFDTEPYDVALVDEDGVILPIELWIPGFAQGIHPVLNVPWVCVSGTRGYYLYQGHHLARWDTDRYSSRADSLINHLLIRAGI